MIRFFLTEFKNGFIDSIRGFLILHKLDDTPQHSVAVAQPRELSAEPSTKQTILEQRRMKQNNSDKKVGPSSAPIQTKVPAVRRVFENIALNLIIIIILQGLIWTTEWFVPNKESNLYILCAYFRMTLILPIFLVIRIISTLWFADVANASYRYCGSNFRSSVSIDISRATSDFLHSVVVELLFLFQALLLGSFPVPYVGWFLSLVYMSLLHSLYSFEYMWMSRNYPMHMRLLQIEKRWPYHLGFGTILTIITSLSSNFVLNSCLFGALFPFFIISSFVADNSEQNSKCNQIYFFYFAQLLTNKLSLTLFKFINAAAKN